MKMQAHGSKVEPEGQRTEAEMRDEGQKTKPKEEPGWDSMPEFPNDLVLLL